MEILKFSKTIFIILIFTLVWFVNCSDKSKNIFDPILENQIQFGLSERNYPMEDIIKRQGQISVDSGLYLLKFSTDEIRKDTIIEEFSADFFEMNLDTSFQVFFGDTIYADMVVRRDSVGVQEADISGGTIKFRFNNYTNKNALFKLIFPSFTKTSGNQIDTLSAGGSIPPNAVVNYSTNLTSYKYKVSSNQPGYPAPGFWIKLIIAVQNGSIGDRVGVYSEVENLKFTRMKGIFPPFNVGVKQQTLENALSRDISGFIQNVVFDSFLVKIKGATSIDFPVRLKNLSVKGLFKDNRPPILLKFGNTTTIDTIIGRRGTVTLMFDNTNHDVNEFLSKAPDSIQIKSEMIINPFYESGEILANDSITFSSKIDAWSRFTLTDAEWTDTFEVDISRDVRDKLKNGKNFNLTFYSENRIPFECFLTGLLVDSLYRPLFYLTKDLIRQNDSTLLLNGAFTDLSGFVTAPRYQTITIPLNVSEIQKFRNAYYLIQKFSVSTTDRRLAIVRAKDSFKIKISGQAIINLTGDDF